MRERSRRSRGAAVAAAAALLCGAGLAGCDAGDGPPGSGPSPAASPSPSGWDRAPKSVAAVGDSITRALNACQVLSDCPEASWATGGDTTVDSLAVRLLGKAEAAGNSWNDAVSGARMADLDAQMKKAVAHRPELVTVLAGANDACRATTSAMTPVADFRAQFVKALGTLREALPRAQVYVASVPDLKRLWSAGRDDPAVKKIWSLGICPSMLGDADALDAASDERRDRVRARVVAYNEVLEEVCAEDRLCRYDGGAVFEHRFGTAQLSSWDYFHPSKDGQARLAEIAYRTVTAKRPVA